MPNKTDNPSTKPIERPGDRLGALEVPRTYVVRYDDGNECEITGDAYHIDEAKVLHFTDRQDEIRASFRTWASVKSKLHDEEHPERGSDVAPV
jgi:hypothetical protein